MTCCTDETDWRFHLQSGTTGLDEKEIEHNVHAAEAPVNGIVPTTEPGRAPRGSVVAMNLPFAQPQAAATAVPIVASARGANLSFASDGPMNAPAQLPPTRVAGKTLAF
jgi:hypothetical protein